MPACVVEQIRLRFITIPNNEIYIQSYHLQQLSLLFFTQKSKEKESCHIKGVRLQQLLLLV
jgi:hypothetical protein